MLVREADPVVDCEAIDADGFDVRVDVGEAREEPVATGVDVGI